MLRDGQNFNSIERVAIFAVGILNAAGIFPVAVLSPTPDNRVVGGGVDIAGLSISILQ